MLLMMDTYSATYALLILALAECVAIGWVYGKYVISLQIQFVSGVVVHRANNKHTLIIN